MAPSAIFETGAPGLDTTAIIVPDPLTVNDITTRRTAAGRLIAGTAAWTSSDLFKKPPTGKKPKAKRWDHLLSLESRSRKGSTLKGAAKYLKKPGMISLGGGLPCPEYFPIERLDIKVPAIGKFSEKETKECGVVASMGKYEVSEGFGAYDLSIGLNYAQGTGSAQVLRWVTEHTELVSNPPYEDWQCSLSVGNTNALEQAYRMFCERGDYIITEEYAFASAVETCGPLGIRVLGVAMDAEGLLPTAMDELLSTWDERSRGAHKPHFLYTVPTGQNPTGATMGAQRRRDVYKVCQKHDVFIIEDEPYFFLQMQPYTGAGSPDAPAPKSNEEFLSALVPTLLSMDTDGRVMRLDSFSKVIAPGTRVGWITASAQIVERFVMHNECSNQNPSGISQMVLYKLLDDTWGHDGYLQWLINLRLEYTRRRDALLGACEKYLPTEVVNWNAPAAGMFLWMELDWTQHSDAETRDILEIEEQIFLAAIEQGTLISRGSWFIADKTMHSTRMFFRATFAAASSEAMATAIERFGVAVRQCFRI